MNCEVTKLNSGEYAVSQAIEILSIPDLSILKNEQNEKFDFVSNYKNNFSAFIKDFGFLVSSNLKPQSDGAFFDCSAEFLWTTKEVSNQPYKAQITVYFILRAIGYDKDNLLIWLKQLMKTRENILQQYQFLVKEVEIDKISKLLNKCATRQTKSIIKQPYCDGIYTQMVQNIFAYDMFPNNNKDFIEIVNTLSHYPDSFVSFQLIPLLPSAKENLLIDYTYSILESASSGSCSPYSGMMTGNSIATKDLATYKYYRDSHGIPLYAYNILINAPAVAMMDISANIVNQISTVKDGSQCRLITENISTQISEKNVNIYPWIIAEEQAANCINKVIDEKWKPYAKLPLMITAEEGASFFRLPIAMDSNCISGLAVNTTGNVVRHTTKAFINTGDIFIGKLKGSMKNDNIGITLKDINKHMLITGMPGSGKSNFGIGLLNLLWRDHHIPFLIIEPAKIEYRALIDKIPDLQIFTPGKNLSPFIMNLFMPPTNVPLSSHKSVIKKVFEAGVDLGGDHTHLFMEAIDRVYMKFGWQDSFTTANGKKAPNIDDFLQAYNEVVEKMHYTGENEAIATSGALRIRALSYLFNTYKAIPIEDLLKKPTLIELAGIEDEKQKCLIIVMILQNIQTYITNNFISDEKLKNVIMFEEAHVLLAAHENQAGSSGAESVAIAKQLINRMLAEIRAAGVGMIIADQSPEKVGNDVVRMTNIKVTFKLVDAIDKKQIADSTNMPISKQKRLTLLSTGEAFLFMDGMEEPEEVVIDYFRQKEKIKLHISDNDIKNSSTYYDLHKQLLKPFYECDKIDYCKNKCSVIFKNIASQLAKNFAIVTQNHTDNATNLLDSIKIILSEIPSYIKENQKLAHPSPQLIECFKLHYLRELKYKGCYYLDENGEQQVIYLPDETLDLFMKENITNG